MAETSSAAAAAQTDAEREEALDRMLTRLALAEDARLAPLLARVLPYAITSLASATASVRKLPLKGTASPENIAAELKVAPAHSSLRVRLMGVFCRSIAAANAFPYTLQCIFGCIYVFLFAIGECNTHKVGDNVASKYQSISGSNDGLVFADFCFHTVLYQTPPQGVGCPAGLSVAQSDRVTGKQPLKGDTLTSRKLGILNVIEAMQLAPEIVYPLYLAAASDSQESVTKRGEELLKRKASAVNLEDSNLMKKLFTLFNGTASAENIAAELKVAPAHSSLRVRLMGVFCRSIAAANAFPYTLQCIFGCIYEFYGMEAATALATAYKGASVVILKDLEALLLENSQMEQSEVRFSAVRWATTLYDMKHCPSRYICMLGASDVKLDIREMALTGLNLLNDERESFAIATDSNYPDIADMVNYVYSQQPQLLHCDEQRNGKLLFPTKTFLAMIKFLMKCFQKSDGSDFLQEDLSNCPVSKLCIILEHAMSYEGSSELHALALKSLVDISSRQPKLVSSRYVNRLLWLRTLLGHVDADAREATSRLLGITSSALSSTAALDLLSELTSTFDQNRPSRPQTILLVMHPYLSRVTLIKEVIVKKHTQWLEKKL
uniref:Proteasome component Ecm29 N-terminal domain-containing protein n=1 Tax=Oryza rufipogon TaxID=4529 RepID=A0A0E0R3W2_ORYRU